MKSDQLRPLRQSVNDMADANPCLASETVMDETVEDAADEFAK